jgi:ABC-2 type transport system permease protein
MSAFFTVTKKELQDHFNSWRFLVLLLIMVVAIVYIFLGARGLRSAISSDTPSIFLGLFSTQAVSTSTSFIPGSFIGLMAILIPVSGIILGLDAINSERSNGTLGRLVSQPIYRDNIINAKFLAGILTIAIMIVTTVLLGGAMGMRIIGIAPGSEELLRIIFFVFIAIIYGAFWLGLSILFSTLFKQVAISAIVSIAVWLFFAFFYPIIFEMISNAMNPVDQAGAIKNAQTLIFLSRCSPIQLFQESIAVILVPITRSASQLFQLIISDAANYFIPNPLSVGQSLISIWPQLIIMVLMTVVCFAVSYVKFMFEEIRSM